ncbi:MAG: hypothetical protein ACI955_002682, partial [Zhongshania sp.]
MALSVLSYFELVEYVFDLNRLVNEFQWISRLAGAER